MITVVILFKKKMTIQDGHATELRKRPDDSIHMPARIGAKLGQQSKNTLSLR
jgi:hypothetical protein